MQITQGYEITHFLRTTAYIKIISLFITYILYQFFPPVHFGKDIVIRTVISGSIRIFGNGRLGNHCSPVTIISLCSVILFHRGHIVRPFRSGRRLFKTEVSSEWDFRFLFESAFGCQQDNAVRTFHTVNRSCRSVFQYGNRFNFVHIDIVEVTFDTVHQY